MRNKSEMRKPKRGLNPRQWSLRKQLLSGTAIARAEETLSSGSEEGVSLTPRYPPRTPELTDRAWIERAEKEMLQRVLFSASVGRFDPGSALKAIKIAGRRRSRARGKKEAEKNYPKAIILDCLGPNNPRFASSPHLKTKEGYPVIIDDYDYNS
jgi:hypothetical protein